MDSSRREITGTSGASVRSMPHRRSAAEMRIADDSSRLVSSIHSLARRSAPQRRHCGFLTFITILLASGGFEARAQEGVASFRKPVLMVETEGHHAPVRALAWPNATTLLSAGLDKVVKQWDLGDEAKLVRTIRPPVWRGPAGIIYAMAVSPWKLKDGRQLLAVAGYGVSSLRGDFTIYAFPGPAEPLAGEPLARLMPPSDQKTFGPGNALFAIAFNPKSQSLATAGASGVVTIWNTATMTPIRALKGHEKGIRALAYLPDGRKLVTVGEDKTLRLWDLDTATEVGRHQSTSILNALAVSPDGSVILAGSESGTIDQFDPADVRTAKLRLPTRPEQGAIECLAFRPDGKQFLAGVMTSKADMAVASDRDVACDIELRDLPIGEVVWSKRLTGLIYAARFRPDGKAFAYSGGSDQAIYIQELADLKRAPSTLRGKGTTVYDIGFTADSRAVGFSRTFGPPVANSEIDAFDVVARKTVRLPVESLRRSISTFDGWSIQGSISRYELNAVKDGAIRWKFDLDRNLERLWWSYTFIPPGPGHTRPTVAVGTESGVLVFDLETGKRTRAFAGHSSPVVSLAPSPDGRWLASGSVDQTAMLYPLEGVDVRPTMGLLLATTKAGTIAVESVEPRGFAGLMGLLPGDQILKTMIARGPKATMSTEPAAILDFLRAANDLSPQTSQIGIWLRRTQFFGPFMGFTADYPPVPSLKRNNPAMSLMLDIEREWVLWTPQGYYETSIEGDTRLLGWHINAPYNEPKSNDYLPIATFQDMLRRPKLLEELWKTGDIDRAIAATLPKSAPPLAVVYDERPPRISFAPVQPVDAQPIAGRPWTLDVAEAKVRVTVTAEGKAGVEDWEAFLDQKRIVRRDVKAGEPATEELTLPLIPNRTIRLAVQARNLRGVSRAETLDLLYIPPPSPPQPTPEPKPEPKPRASRLEVIALGTQVPKGSILGAIPFADPDTRDLAPFLATHLFPTAPKAPSRLADVTPTILNQGKATSNQVRSELERLLGQAKDQELLPGDAVVVSIIANGVEDREGLMFALADTSGEKTPTPLFPAKYLSETLGALATDYGCRVVLFLDLIHGEPTENFEAGLNFKAWVRDLYQNRQVIVFVASKEAPSLNDDKAGHGMFALGLLGAFEQVGAAAGVRDRSANYTLMKFKTAVVERILEQSGRRQQAGCYIPKSVSQGIRFASPKTPSR